MDERRALAHSDRFGRAAPYVTGAVGNENKEQTRKEPMKLKKRFPITKTEGSERSLHEHNNDKKS